MKVLVLRLLLTVARRLKLNFLLCAAALLSSSPQERAALLYIKLRYFRRASALAPKVAEIINSCQVDARDITAPLIGALVADKGLANELVRFCEETLDAGALNSHEAIGALRYTKSLLSKDFNSAYRHWRGLASTKEALANLERRSKGFIDHEDVMAVVLPGDIESDLLEDIGRHRVIAFTSLHSPKQIHLGDRAAYFFLNYDRFSDLCRDPKGSNAGSHIITKTSCASLKDAYRVGRPEMDSVTLPVASDTYLTIQIIFWCLEKGCFKPELYFGDFYTGQRVYGDSQYDKKSLLAKNADILCSYYAHDVFFAQAAMHLMQKNKNIIARGRLGEVIRLSGAEFAKLLSEKWGKS